MLSQLSQGWIESGPGLSDRDPCEALAAGSAACEALAAGSANGFADQEAMGTVPPLSVTSAVIFMAWWFADQESCL